MVAVVAERHTVDRPRVAFEGANLLAAGEIPQFDRVVETGRGEQLSVGAECHAVNQGVVSVEFLDLLGRGDKVTG